MKILSCSLQNFASYESLEFEFNQHGITLIQGPTGSGKSTLCDAAPWVLFGKTAKGGTVDEVLSWPGDKVTKGTLFLENVTVHRSRGPKAKDNDLMFWPVDGQATRGKDLNDTQKLLNSFLGIDYDLYLSGAYFHEFSQTSQFFTTTAKNRRMICEQIVDLSLAKKLQLNVAERAKKSKKLCDELQGQINTVESNIALLRRLEESENTRAATWDEVQRRVIIQLEERMLKFELSRKKTISKKCNSCGTVLEKPKEIIDDSTNPFVEQIKDAQLQTNPHAGAVKDYSGEIAGKNEDLAALKVNKLSLEVDEADLSLLLEVTTAFRSALIQNTVQDLENQTNKLLTDHFDADIQISLETTDADKLEVTVTKDGNTCTYTQLSKGQRQLLKLCFGVAIMRCVANHHGLNFSQIFFDEALDGCDDQVKLKALGLLRTMSLEYDTIFIIEHSSEFKAQLDTQYKVALVNGHSQLCLV